MPAGPTGRGWISRFETLPGAPPFHTKKTWQLRSPYGRSHRYLESSDRFMREVTKWGPSDRAMPG